MIMVWFRGVLVTFSIALILGVACKKVELPTARVQPEIYRRVEAPMDVVWNAALRVVEEAGAELVTSNRASGVIAYRISDVVAGGGRTSIFINVVLKEGGDGKETVVYVMPQTIEGMRFTGPDARFFSRLGHALEDHEDE
jgi:hypothetical protein